MSHENFVIDINNLARRYGRTDAVNGLSLRVAPDAGGVNRKVLRVLGC